MATRKTVLRVSNLIGMSSKGSKGDLVRAFRTRDKSHGGGLTDLAGIILEVAFKNLIIQGLAARDFPKKVLRAVTCTLRVAVLRPFSTPLWRKSNTILMSSRAGAPSSTRNLSKALQAL